MKRTFFLAAVLLVNTALFAPPVSHVPSKMNYQAVMRNSSNVLIVNQKVGMMISILQGSALSGTVVYAETQTPTTNANGLINIEIGTGTIMSGNFSAIDWTAGPCSLKTEIDPAGGTTYSIASISELLSVPYAQHAKTAESITGSGSSVHYVGELFGGGVVCRVDHTGMHGLILSMVDLTTTGHIWSNVSQVTQNLSSTNDWDGAANTIAIIGQSGHTTSAAKLCADYTNADYGTGIFSDWYLPGIAELNQIANSIFEIQKTIVMDGSTSTTPLKGNFYTGWTDNDVNIYWSSSAFPVKGNDEGGEYTLAWAYNFNIAEKFGLTFGYTMGSGFAESSKYNVRAMRAF